MIDEMKVRFSLTGNSDRKPRQSYTKLMGGRTRSSQIHPFVYPEINAKFALKKMLSCGTLPNGFRKFQRGSPIWLGRQADQ
ncbi:hypothetical protein EBU99_11295 [bacterium]|nr:hypothetical protein [bacterium]